MIMTITTQLAHSSNHAGSFHKAFIRTILRGWLSFCGSAQFKACATSQSRYYTQQEEEIKIMAFSTVATHIIFTYPMESDRTIPVAEAFAFVDDEDKRWTASRVVWADGGSSWAKSWRFSKDGRMARIGAGACGDLTVLRRDEE
jgi:hypothetical protein